MEIVSKGRKLFCIQSGNFSLPLSKSKKFPKMNIGSLKPNPNAESILRGREMFYVVHAEKYIM